MTVTTASATNIARYIEAMMQAFAPRSAAGRKLTDWLRRHQHGLGIDLAAAVASPTRAGRRRKPVEDKPVPAQAWLRLRRILGRSIASDDRVDANIAGFAAAVGLDALEAEVLRFVFHADRGNGLGDLCTDLVATGSIDSVGLIGVALRRPASELWDRLQRGPLRSLGLVDLYDTGASSFACCVPYRVRAAMLPPRDGLADIERRLIGEPMRPEHGPGDFDHVAREREFVLRLLRGALAARQGGVNLLLYGPPGAGKSEFCKTVAAALGAALFAVGEVDADGEELSRGERVDALRLADRLAARRGNALLLFDEMEDVLQHGDVAARGTVRRAGSKVFFNRLLEQNRVPVLWTANGVEEFDPAFLRRMAFTFEMKLPPPKARATLWQRLAGKQGLSLPADAAAMLARRHDVAPGVMRGATRAVAMAGGTAEEIGFVAGAIARPLGGAPRPEIGSAAAFTPELANADTDLAALERALTRPDAVRDVALCLHGAPGTGKSAFARRLAEAMGLDPLVRRGSDLLSKWIGETERRIAAAFEEARLDSRMLILDEAEGLLWHRGGASRSWEVSMVNELLSAMEAHPLPFACTTNHLDCIDPAALRRFDVKIGFDFMTAAQGTAAYRRFFDRAAPRGLAELVALTPGDFAAVAKRLRLVEARNDAAILQLLEREVAAKRLPSRRMGF